MKKLVIAIVLLSVNFTLINAQTIEFKNKELFKDLMYKSTGIDQNKDGLLQVEEANNVLYFDIMIESNDIQDLKCFKNIESLYFICNSIGVSIDTLDLSNFPNLKILDIGCKHVKHLDISKNVKLENIRLEHYNQDFDGSNFPELKFFSFNYSKIKTLDLKSNSKLEGLYVYEFNTVKTIIFPDKNNIKELELSLLNYIKQNLKPFNMLNRVSIEDISYTKDELLNYRNTKVFYIYGYFDLKILNEFNNLKEVVICNDSINEIDLSKNILLTKLNVQGKKIESIKLNNNLQIKNLEISKTKINTLNTSNLKYLRKLILKGNKISVLDLSYNYSINEITIDCTEIKKIILPYNVTSSIITGSINGIEIINTPQPTLLSNYVKIKDKQLFNALIKAGVDINQNGKIEKFEAIQCTKLNISNSKIRNISGLESFINLKDLDISKNEISIFPLDKIKYLKRLNCSYNQINKLYINNMADMEYLIAHHNLIDSIYINADDCEKSMNDSINVSYNQLKSIELNMSFTNIDVSHNKLKSISGIAPAMLDLSYNQLKEMDLSKPNLFFVYWLNCTNNPIQEIKINDRTKYLKCDKILIDSGLIKKYNLTVETEY